MKTPTISGVARATLVLLLLVLSAASLFEWLQFAKQTAQAYRARSDDGTVSSEIAEDYIVFYVGARMVMDGEGSEIYTDRALEREAELGGVGDLPFFHPPFVAVAIVPLAVVSLRDFAFLWGALVAVALLGAGSYGPRWMGLSGRMAVTASVCTFGSAAALLLLWHEQFSAFLMIGWLGFIAGQRAGDSKMTGLSVALLLLKPHMAILPAIWLVGARDWKSLAWVLGAGAGGLVVSVAAADYRIPFEYASFIIRSIGWHNELGVAPVFMIGWNSLFADHVVVVALSLVTLAVVAWRPTFSGMAAATLLVSPHTYGHDLLIVFPALWAAIAADGRASRGSAVLMVLTGGVSLWHGELLARGLNLIPLVLAATTVHAALTVQLGDRAARDLQRRRRGERHGVEHEVVSAPAD